MRKLLLVLYSIILLVIALMFGMKSYYLTETNNYQSFWSNLYLNFVPEFIGAAVGILIPLIILAWFADKKLEKLAQPILELIAQLRADGRITELGARRSVVCAVKLISENNMKGKSISLCLTPREGECDVCTLKIENSDDNRCKFCGLKDKLWKFDEELKESLKKKPTSISTPAT